MAYYVYIIQSELDNSYYKGFSLNPLQRLIQHNNAESNYTSHKIPWKLLYIEILETKKNALIREKYLKKLTRDRITMLIASPKNIIHSI